VRRPKGYWHLPGLVYDLAFKIMLRGVRRRVARTVEREGLYPWLDVCSGTGDQLQAWTPGNLAIGLDLHFGFVKYAAGRAQGVPFVCGDAARMPFKDGSARAVSISFGLHDKHAELRKSILNEARRALAPDGRLIVIDFERPWSVRSRAGAFFAQAIERLAPREHYRNGREFLRSGGLRALLGDNGFIEVERRDVEAGSLAIVVAQYAHRERS
jgi:demethylmenaquinone methyltransferase/2-methoxy-6-polyprenyl-1,4-benzoquinol methylase